MTCHGTDCVLPSHHRKNTPCLLVFWQSFYLSSVYFYFITVFSYASNPSLLQPKEKRSSQCRVTQTLLIHPHSNREGYPRLVWCLELTRHRVPKALAYRSRECVLGEIRPSCFGNAGGGLSGSEWRKSSRKQRLTGREGAVHGTRYLLWNSWAPTPFCFWNTIVWYLVCPLPSAFFSFHFSPFHPLDLNVPVYIWKMVCPNSWVYVLFLWDIQQTFCHQLWYLKIHSFCVVLVCAICCFLKRAVNINKLFSSTLG